jgi:predicted ester cyclase
MSTRIIFLLAILLSLEGCESSGEASDRTIEGSAEDIKVVEQFMVTLDAQEFGDLEDVLCPELVVHLAGEDFGRTEFIQRTRGVYKRYLDFRHEIEEIFAAPDRVVLRATDYATHAETGRSVSFGQISIYRIEDGCIAEFWEELDRDGLKRQLTEPDPESHTE